MQQGVWQNAKLLLQAFKDEDRQRGPRKHRGTLGKTRGLGVGNSYAILGRQTDPGKDKGPGVGNSYAILGRQTDPGKDKCPGVGNSYAILGIIEKLIK